MLDLKQRRIELNLTMLEVAKLVGVSEATISRYESGNIKNMRRDRIEKYAKALQVSPSEFLDIQEEPQISKIPYTEEGTVLVPLIGKVAAGYSCHAEDNISEYIRTDGSSLKTGYDYFWLEVKGDSMEPELHEKDLVLVQEQSELDAECYAVVTVDNEDGLVKQVQIDNTKITLKSINPYYPPRIFEKQDMNRIKIVGRVIEIKRRLV
ncbi:MAG TPA: XRE family transcriptional regulator [Ruminococcus flavefaciens]|nr:XRE family transcriptional regulator [Ruminococcus flavefaciens]HQL99325.1 XRE family transcriptional regulator [Ruminococcus flavefaciens]